MKFAALFALSFGAALGLAACQSDTAPYVPAARPTSAGYVEYRIEPGRYTVTFRGNMGASRNDVERMALKRAADLTLSDGYDWFQVINGYGDSAERDTTGKIATGVDPEHRGPVLGGKPAGDEHGVMYTQTIEVQMGKGARPDDSRYYDARTVRAGGKAP